MKTYDIKLQKRTEVGKKATKKIRRDGYVPCEVYGGAGNVHCFGAHLDFEKSIHTPHVYQFNLDMDGEKRKAIVQAIQYHPVTDRILHIDFLTVDDTKLIGIKLPVELVGTAIGVIRGGKLRPIMRKVHVLGLLSDLPETVKVDISKLAVGDSLKIGQLSAPGVTFLDSKDSVVVSVGVSRTIAKDEEVLEAADGVEGEEATEEEAAE
ncbi:MAG: 50S ribosomal protein L25 [Salinivirgaceae bacterium]|nr:50S ribosomal protein L25 [Salinivirgaceae bacterium]MDD4746635.1 50S ribosomal protein L25 [Salinivirgaceae bacterium]